MAFSSPALNAPITGENTPLLQHERQIKNNKNKSVKIACCSSNKPNSTCCQQQQNPNNDDYCQLAEQPWQYKMTALICALLLAGKLFTKSLS